MQISLGFVQVSLDDESHLNTRYLIAVTLYRFEFAFDVLFDGGGNVYVMGLNPSYRLLDPPSRRQIQAASAPLLWLLAMSYGGRQADACAGFH